MKGSPDNAGGNAYDEEIANKSKRYALCPRFHGLPELIIVM